MNVRLAGVVVVLVAVTSSVLTSQVVKSERFPQFDNEDVKVWKTVIQPHQPLDMHHHDHPRVIVALSGGDLDIVTPDGGVEPHHWETGKAYWLPAMAPGAMHSDANAGEKPIEVMVVELEKEK